MTLELAADAADIFEVRGWTRAARGRQLPIAARPDRVTFRYDGPRRPCGRRPTSRSASPPTTVEPVDPEVAGTVERRLGPVHLALADGVGRGARAALGRLGRSSVRCRRRRRRRPRTPSPTTRCSRPSRWSPVDEVAASYHAWSRSVSRDPDRQRARQPRDRPLRRATCGCSSTTARATPSGTSPPGVPWFTTLFGRDAIIASFQALCVRPQVAVETLEVLASLQAADEDPERDAEPGKILNPCTRRCQAFLRSKLRARTGHSNEASPRARGAWTCTLLQSTTVFRDTPICS